MARKFNSNGIADGTLPGTKISSGTISASLVGSVRISSISITDNSYVVLDDTAVILTGGYIKIIGTGFVSGCSVAIDTTIATSVSFVSATQLNVQVPAKAAGTYNIYLTTPTGAVAIRVNAITYSSTPTWTSTSPLPGGVNNTAISIQLGATSDSTVSYTVQAGSTLPAGLTLSSGGLLAGTVTGLALETTYNFTVVATDVELQDSPKAFSITIIVSDPYFKNTVLLLQGDLTPFTADASTNKFELSAVGTPSANTNNPLQPGYYSGYFNGSTDYLSVPNINFSTNAFTIEGWFYPFSLATATNFWGTDNGSGSSPKMLMYINGSAQLTIDFGTAGTTQFPIAASIATYGLNTYQWNHIALVRSDLTATGLKLYINGILAGTGQVGTNLSTITAIFNVGYIGEAYGTKFNGYISNTRVIKGVAVYTGNFTPQTSSLTSTQSAGFLAATATPTVDVLVVAGGGGGGNGVTGSTNGGGGGAGGYRTDTGLAVSSGSSITVTVGAGGAGGNQGVSGTNSVFGAITSIAGGGGGSRGSGAGSSLINGLSGGSGGGGGFRNDGGLAGGTGGAGTVGQGNNGGNGQPGSPYGGGGGGGAGAVGTPGSNNNPDGGIGLQSSISGTATYYSGGGGGKSDSGVGAGGTGGGGNSAGSSGQAAVAGTTNTGGGGGAGAGVGGAESGASGGSGIVVLRYSSSYSLPSSTTGNPSVVVAGGYRIYTWTTSGTITFGDSNIAAITGTATSLLTCQSNRFIDNSSTPQTITVSGTPIISVAQPFTLPSPYTGYGSGLFNGSSYVSAPTNATKYQFLQSGTYTLEAWVYFTNPASATEGVITTGPVGTMKIYLSKGGGGITNGIDSDASVGYTVTHYEWIHLAIVFSAGILKLYKNGVLANSTSYPWNISGTDFIVGRLYTDLSQYQLNGYVASARAVKGVSVYTGAFTPPTLAPLTNAGATSAAAYPSTTNVNTTFASSETSILTLQTNQAQNNNQFRDSSTNNFAVTRTGTPTQGTFTPFSQTGWSGYFNGSGNYLYTPSNAAFTLGTGDFTVEAWINIPLYAAAGYNTIGGTFYQGSSDAYWFIGINESGNVAFSGRFTSLIVSSGTVPLNTWTHIAVSRSSGITKVFINGTLSGTSSTVINFNGLNTMLIGSMYNAGVSTGYISNIRVVTGVAVYTGTFTPPTAPLTATQAGNGSTIQPITGTATSVLTLQDNRFKDNSVNNFTITNSGIPSVQAFSPFAPTAAYSTTLVGGSGLFNGTTDYLSVASNAAFGFGTGDFTVETWAYFNSTPARAQGIIDGQTTNGFNFYWDGGTYSTNKLTISDRSANQIQYTFLPTIGIWYHFAIARQGTNLQLFVNGISVASATSSTNYVTTGFTIGGDASSGLSWCFPGYLSNLRITKGIAVYTGNFTPPTAPLTAIAGTSLLLNATNAGIFDATGKNDLVIVGDTKVSTSKQKYGSGAMYFDGTGDYLSMLAAPNLYFGAGDFTIEAWIWKSANGTGSGGYDGIFQLGISGSVTDGCVLEASSARGYYFTMGGGWSLQYNVSPNDSTWHHVAVSRSGNNTRLFVDGVQQAIYTSAYTIPSTATYALVGAEAGASYPFNGYIDDLRITKGVGRYTTTFTPPSQAMLGM